MADNWKPTTEPGTCAMRDDPHTPVRVLAVDLPGSYLVAYYKPKGDWIVRVRETGRRHPRGLPSSLDLVPYRPKIEA